MSVYTYQKDFNWPSNKNTDEFQPKDPTIKMLSYEQVGIIYKVTIATTAKD